MSFNISWESFIEWKLLCEDLRQRIVSCMFLIDVSGPKQFDFDVRFYYMLVWSRLLATIWSSIWLARDQTHGDREL